MASYNLDINGKVSLKDYSKIKDYMDITKANDKFTVALNDKNIDTNLICQMLKDDNFKIDSSKGSEKNGKFYISAIRQ